MILYEVKVNYQRQDGETNKAKDELYLVEAISMADAEKKVIEVITPYLFAGEVEMKHCRKVQYMDIFDDPNYEKFYKVRVEMIYIDNEKETRKTVTILTAANNTKDADRIVRDKMAGQDAEIISIVRTNLVEYLH